MAGSYYVQAEVKLILNIAASDTADDSLLDDFGDVVNQHIDNILKIHDEKIPLQGANVLEDIKKAANFHVASLYYSHTHNLDEADKWMERSTRILNGIKQERTVENSTYSVERHMGHYRGYHDHYNEAGFSGG
jgi:hypothetical protein